MSKSCCLLLGSYNCESTIVEQLESIHIAFQNTKYCCLYFDDGSNDSSLHLINYFFSEKNIHAINIKVDKNSSISQKFYELFINALLYTNSDVYFLADGDDVWLKEKVEYTINAVENGTGLVLSNTMQFGDLNELIKPNINRFILQDFIFNVSPGMSYGFSRDNLEKFIKFGGVDYYWHDHGLFLFSKYILCNVLVVNEVLQKYRRHSGQYTAKFKLYFLKRILYMFRNIFVTIKIYLNFKSS